ncbi:MAG: hypothetical protein NTU99_09525, partial [Pseudanabaena sp. LacPavin_0818_WC45_MAG_42_6]|nr:hypothetical protein [Pseudanabaena sp. LacPavin_0818_WC45_MAG_42_6]
MLKPKPRKILKTLVCNVFKIFLVIRLVGNCCIAIKAIARTNQNPKQKWRREAPLLLFWGLICSSYRCYCYTAIADQTNHKKNFK